MLTLTAPGVDFLPWDESACIAPPGHAHSGKLGCRVEAWPADDWNESAPHRLSRLLEAAHAATARRGLRAGRGRPPWLALPDLQSRGVLHWHYLFASADRPYVVQLRRELQRLAPQYGFGGQVDFAPCLEEGSSKGVAYIVKAAEYVAKAAAGSGTGQREQLVAMLRGPFVGRPFLRASPKLTRASRVTMRNLRHRRTLYARGRITSRLSCEVVEGLMVLEVERAERDRLERALVVALAAAFCDLPPPHSRGFRTMVIPMAGVDYDRQLFRPPAPHSDSPAHLFFTRR